MDTIDRITDKVLASLNQPKPTEPKQQLCEQQSQVGLPLKENAEGRQRLATLLYEYFQGMKTYGKDPESLEGIIALFNRTLASYPYEKVEMALTVHASRNAEFPTPADIVGLIKRNGKPPFSKEVYISISKKDPELRDPYDWKYLREYEAEQSDEAFGTAFRDDRRAEVSAAETARLRKEVGFLRTENKRLGQLLIAPPEPHTGAGQPVARH